ncbi:DUF1995 family protein [Gloeobacter morelensis]|uniref:DUF1995 family protein n=1 Tax=Gloeobacter morelensis MG652769 TaxID=2781736 RepID=A0ABY3PNM7_9CYAN|nr:DUF1995 family protein [Gloeobacter morelensis]UFP95297.1 DUF1995 family protein [Gloeobacter morelensis MG652769]
MSELPRTLDETLAQCSQALAATFESGKTRAQIDIKVPGLDVLSLVQGLAPALGESGWAAAFPDPGAAALARRRLGSVGYDLRGLSELKLRGGEHRAVLVVEPSAIEVETVETLADRMAGKPFILLNSRLQEAGAVGIGLAGRQLRERFLSTFEMAYAIQPFEGGSLYRAHPKPWQLWRETQEGDYTKVAEFDTRPLGEEIDRALYPKKGEALLDGLRRFLRALGQ